jgi:hypothetical protein
MSAPPSSIPWHTIPSSLEDSPSSDLAWWNILYTADLRDSTSTSICSHGFYTFLRWDETTWSCLDNGSNRGWGFLSFIWRCVLFWGLYRDLRMVWT